MVNKKALAELNQPIDTCKLKEFNRQSVIKLKKTNPFVVATNPGFFDESQMPKFGYQTFDVVQQGDKNYLTVDRSIVHKNRRVDLNTSVYEIDDKSNITKLVGYIKKKIRSIATHKEY